MLAGKAQGHEKAFALTSIRGARFAATQVCGYVFEWNSLALWLPLVASRRTGHLSRITYAVSRRSVTPSEEFLSFYDSRRLNSFAAELSLDPVWSGLVGCDCRDRSTVKPEHSRSRHHRECCVRDYCIRLRNEKTPYHS